MDVFTDRPLEGNQLAVFPVGAAVDPARMQAVAQEMSFSETTFVLPPEQAGTESRIRIFTPRRELPMAGHPVIGTAFALAHESAIGSTHRRVVLGLGIGPTVVDLEWAGDELHFAWMTQHPPQFGPILDDMVGIARALSLDASDMDTSLPVEQVSCGFPFILVPLRTRDAVDRCAVDEVALKAVHWPAEIAERSLLVFSTQTRADDEATAYSRMFAAGLAVVEDPATGSASGPLGCYLLEYGIVPPERAGEIVNRQGVKMGRPSRIFVAISGRPGAIETVRVGGTAVLVGEGNLFL